MRAAELKFLTFMQSGEAITAERITSEGTYPVYGGNGLRGFAEQKTHSLEAPLIGRQGALCGNVNYATGEFYASEHAIVAAPRAGVHPRWLYWMLGALDLNQYSMAAAQPGLSVEVLQRIKVAWPEMPLQQRIANFLDEQTARIDTLIAEKEELLQKLPEYAYSQASSLMTRGVDAGVKLQRTSFPELGDIPAHWSVKRLKFLGEVRSGVAKGKDIGDKTTVSLPYLRVANVQDGYVDLTDVKDIEVSAADAERYLLRKGDVLMNEGGDNDKLGRGTVWQGQIDPCIHQNHVFAVRLNDMELAEWVARFTSTDAARSYFFLRSKQSTNLASINQSNVRELPVPMPPAAERKAILEQVRSVTGRAEELTLHVSEHIERLREYRSALIAAAVTGQLDNAARELEPERLAA